MSMPRRCRSGWLVSLLGCFLAGQVLAGSPVTVERAWLRAVPESSDASALYMRVRNLTAQHYELTGGKMRIADSVDLMITTHQGSGTQATIGMEAVDQLGVPPGGELVLEPGGNHLMVMGLKEHPREGAKIPVTLLFEPGHLTVEVEVTVSRSPIQ